MGFSMQTDSAPRASLGCGTIIVLALIVAGFTGALSQKVTERLDSLRSEIAGLRSSVDMQTEELRKLKESIKGKEQPPKSEPAPPAK
jgi:septal ring factor EnvC (AmiA/AmiB activator)